MGRKKAIITGAEIGMGRGIALVLAEEGYDIAFSYYPKAENVEASIETTMAGLKAHGAQGYYVPADLSEPDAPRAFFEKAAYLWLFFALFLLFIGTYYGQNTAADAKKHKTDSRYSYI